MSDAIKFKGYANLAAERLGAAVVYATDDFFAPKERLIDPREPVFIPDKYDSHGKWMDGWESRRKREPGHDFCIVRLGGPASVRGVDIDTRHFNGNHPPEASVDACRSTENVPGNAEWTPLVPRSSLGPGRQHLFDVANYHDWTHLRLNIFPDGGVARLRVYGVRKPVWDHAGTNPLVDLAAIESGGRPIDCSDEHFGRLENILAPGRGVNMGDGWETRRRRDGGNDWAILALGCPGRISKIVVDTAHFKGNYPGHCAIQGVLLSNAGETDQVEGSENWPTILPKQPLGPDREHIFEGEVAAVGPVSHIRLNIFPDGGVSRLRVLGTISEQLSVDP